MKPDRLLEARLASIRSADRFREIERLDARGGAYIEHDGRRLLNLCSNDYLALSTDDRVKRAAAEAAEAWGGGAGSSRLVSGNLAIHETLESASASLVGKETALVFSSGYAANVGTISALAGANDGIFSDALNHASMIDGCRLSRATTHVFPHRDTESLRVMLDEKRRQYKGCWIVTESLFSMDGDCAPLPELVELAQHFECGLIVDEAHALGVFGGGRGLCAETGVAQAVFAIVGTYGKSVGSQGAFVAGNQRLRDYLINTSRSFIFSTGIAPAACGAAIEGLRIIAEEGSDMALRLRDKYTRFREALAEAGHPAMACSAGPIVPVIFGSEAATMQRAETLLERGIYARGIRPPTVPQGQSRIRFSVCLSHDETELVRAATLLS